MRLKGGIVLLTITNTAPPATDLGHLLRKNPARVHSFRLENRLPLRQVLHALLKDKQFDQIVGMDVSYRALEIAQDRLNLDRLPEKQRQRIQLLHGSLMYRDKRLAGFEAAAVVEVIEHLDPPRLAAFERVLFECAQPGTVVLTTPNAEYNVKWETLPAGKLRHKDHRFEWSRAEFQAWASQIGERFGYSVRFLPVGPEDAVVGAPTQMGVFQRG
jgi:3' terminal RNA ribose 2'-O-methyltransferase Hen1